MGDVEMEAERTQVLQALLDSHAPKKVVVAGPGAGKTHTFKEVLERRSTRGLVLTFLTGLVADLHGDLNHVADVYSFHGFAKHLLHTCAVAGCTRDVDYYPPLLQLIAEDIFVVDNVSIDPDTLSEMVRNLADSDPSMARLLACGTYYDAVSHDDSVYRVLRHLEGGTGIPKYEQIVVDEYQDFCPLEVAFIEALATSGPTLIAGDDDQALYAFRSASPDDIRARANHPDWELHQLPYCSRCTEVIVAATHTVVARAQQAGRLQGRIDKRYDCYLPDKRADSERHPTIIYADCSVQSNTTPYMARVIEHQILEISTEDITESHSKGWPTALIIAPKPFFGQIRSYLVDRGFAVQSKPDSNNDPSCLDGYDRIIGNPRSRLGWRILLHCLTPPGWDDAVRKAMASGAELVDELPPEFVAEHLAIAGLLQRVRAEESLSDEDRSSLAAALGVPEAELDLYLDSAVEVVEPPDPDKPTILMTSLMGSKGLQAGHVFIAGLNDQHFPRDNAAPTDVEVCQLLVALTRARKSCMILSCRRLGGMARAKSVFVDWLRPHLQPVYVDKDVVKKL